MDFIQQAQQGGSGGAGPSSIKVQPPGGGPDTGGDDDRDAVAILKKMISLAQQYVQVEQDDTDKHTMMKVLTQLQSYLANEQKEQEAAMGTSPAMKFLSKNS